MPHFAPAIFLPFYHISADIIWKHLEPWRRFSPFYPHGGIPVPFSPGQVSASVEGIWQGLKVFQSMDVDTSPFAVTTMKGIKRSARKYGAVLGHRAGVDGDRLLPYVEARYQIYLPSYRWVLEHCLQDLLTLLKTWRGRSLSSCSTTRPTATWKMSRDRSHMQHSSSSMSKGPGPRDDG